MDDVERIAEDVPGGAGMARRTFFRRALLVAGGTVGVMTLAGCPSGGEDGDDDDDEQENDGGENDGGENDGGEDDDEG